MAQVYERIDPIAKASGARLVHCCGFDSVPSDLSVYFLQKALSRTIRTLRFPGVRPHGSRRRWRQRRYGGEPDVRSRAGIQRHFHSRHSDGPLRAIPTRHGKGGLTKPDQAGISWDDDFGSWTGPFVMAAINTKVVRRSHALAGLPYGADFGYDESQLCSSRAKAILSAGGLRYRDGHAPFFPTRALLKKLLPDPGEGPNKETRDKGFFEFGRTGAMVRTVCRSRSPGNATRVMVPPLACWRRRAYASHRMSWQ